MKQAMRAALGAAMVLGGCASLQPARSRLVREPPRCADETVSIYFEPQSAQLTRESRLVVDQAASAARGCQVRAVEVTGLADAAGAPAANLELSNRRAAAVGQALAGAGLPTVDLKLSAAGQAGATTAEGRSAPLRRRAEVTLRLAPAK
ncbi:MAG TPA: OmpA family protein [Phenylobacterium sp.]|uniref:OmpA family protein n=1 Tax=Phenylobacterium sp. TaxID=1871053 RepID=UPI002BFF2813|nr:OmpA family protein [Phenylobacterium sp.]HSV01582.1 OmpA family protein [Phenylobacterium sp.]